MDSNDSALPWESSEAQDIDQAAECNFIMQKDHKKAVPASGKAED